MRDLGIIGDLYQLIRRERPEIVMGYTHKSALYTDMAEASLQRVRRLFDVAQVIAALCRRWE